MEEILASIRRIISEDDGPAEAEAAPPHEPAPAPEPVAAFEAAPEPAEDVLELTDRVKPETETVGDIEAYTEVEAAEPEPEPEPPAPPPKPVPAPVAVREDERLVSEPSASAANSVTVIMKPQIGSLNAWWPWRAEIAIARFTSKSRR